MTKQADTTTKEDVENWETVTSYVCEFDGGDGACDVEVQIGGVERYTTVQMGMYADECYETQEEAQAAADLLNEDAGMGDGAASVAVVERWYVRTQDDAGGSDDADETAYPSEAAARDAAEAFADAHNDADDAEDAAEYIQRCLEERAGEPCADGAWGVYWWTVGDEGYVHERYGSCEQAEAACELANDRLHAANPGGRLLCGFELRVLRGDQWVVVEDDAQ